MNAPERTSSSKPTSTASSSSATTNAELVALANERLYPNYSRSLPMVLARGKGSEVWDVEGRRWLDFAAGVAVCSVGHAHPRLVATIAEQAGTLMHTSNYFFNEQNIRLADELVRRSGMGRAFFCNSGAEAIEAMFKMTRRHFYVTDRKKTRFVAFENAFHGRTMGAVSLTGTAKYREGFGGVEGVVHAKYGDLDAVAREMAAGDVAGVIVEPVQGEGGVLPAPAGFLEGIRKLCDEHGSLLLLDEVQTGIARTGAWFGHQTTSPGVRPDAMALAKGLGGGFPIGAMVTTEALAGALPPGTHGTTYGGNPLASAAARTVLAIVEEEGLVAGAKAKGEQLARLLSEVARDLPDVCEGERGAGLLRGLILKPGFVLRDVLGKLADAGVLLTAAGERVIRFTPPLVVTEAQLVEGVGIVRTVLSTLTKH